MNEITESLLITLFNDQIDNNIQVNDSQAENMKALAPIIAKVLFQLEGIKDHKIKHLQDKVSDLESEIYKIKSIHGSNTTLNEEQKNYENNNANEKIQLLDKVNCNGRKQKDIEKVVKSRSDSEISDSVLNKANEESDKENTDPPLKTSTSEDGTNSTPEEEAYCNYCKKRIKDSIVRAMGKTWCKNHFMCFTPKCGKPLIGKDIHHLDGSLYCDECHSKYYVPKCAKCKEPVGEKYMDAMDKVYHPECFRCANCKGVIGSGQFYIEGKKPYCMAVCKHLFAKKCATCRSTIQAGDTFVEAMDKTFHKHCFKCTECRKPLEGMSFFLKDGKPVCKLHAKPKLKRGMSCPGPKGLVPGARN